MIDTYNAQDLHLRTLIDFKSSIQKIRKNSATHRISRDFHIDARQSRQRENVYKAKYINNTFKLNEEMGRVYKENMGL